MLLDIVFQSGEFYTTASSTGFWDFLGKLVIGLLGSVIGVSGSLYVFKQSLKNQRDKDLKAKQEFRKEKMLYFKSLLLSIEKSLKLQITHCEDYSKSLLNDKQNHSLLIIEPYQDIQQVLDKINQEDYYHAYNIELPDLKDTPQEYRTIIILLNNFYLTLQENILVILKKTAEEEKALLSDLNDLLYHKSTDMLMPFIVNDQDLYNLVNNSLTSIKDKGLDAFYKEHLLIVQEYLNKKYTSNTAVANFNLLMNTITKGYNSLQKKYND